MAEFPAASVELLATRFHDPAFFQKLAEWKIEPTNDQERTQLLEMATQLRTARDSELEKTASNGNAFLTGALDSLKHVLGAQSDYADTTSNLAIKQAAAKAIQDPAVQKAALEFGTYLTSQAG